MLWLMSLMWFTLPCVNKHRITYCYYSYQRTYYYHCIIITIGSILVFIGCPQETVHVHARIR